MGHIAANCHATWEQVEPKRGGPQQTVPSRPNPHVSYLDGEVGLPAQPSATTSAAPAADPVLQFGTIPARINMMGSAQEPVPLSVFGLNMMAPSQLKDACIQEPVPLQTFGLTMMTCSLPAELRKEVTPITASDTEPAGQAEEERGDTRHRQSDTRPAGQAKERGDTHHRQGTRHRVGAPGEPAIRLTGERGDQSP